MMKRTKKTKILIEDVLLIYCTLVIAIAIVSHMALSRGYLAIGGEWVFGIAIVAAGIYIVKEDIEARNRSSEV